MPQIFRLGSYWVYFWTNENKPLEPVHVHKSSKNGTTISETLNISAKEFCYEKQYFFETISKNQ